MIRLIVILLLTSTISTALRCYHCGHPSRMITPDIWIHKTATCAKRKIVQCSPAAVACVVVRVAHPRIGFGASGCSEDAVTGCDVHELPGTNTTVQRCQCHGDLCNVDLHLSALASYGEPVYVENYQLQLLESIPATTTTLATVNSTRTKSKGHKHVHGQRLHYKNHHGHRTRPPITATMPTKSVSAGSCTSRFGFLFFLATLSVICLQKLFI
uniref:Protein quiver n=1 Tax=Panagrellus redivivus TaxID=6233 RepID=A0A7E4UV60_PANRE